MFVWGVLLGAPSPARAEQRLREFESAPFSLATHPKMAVEVLALESTAGFAAASALPESIAVIDLVQLSWPKSKQACVLGVAMTGARYGQNDAPMETYVTLGLGDAKPQILPLPPELASAMVSRVCVWPSGPGEAAELVFLLSLIGMDLDCPVLGFALTADGTVLPVDTGQAMTLFGWFDARDLDEDGSYELITGRSLDGVPGGFFYHAVRTYEPTARAYQARPDAYPEYFGHELAWLTWVVETKAQIEADPAPYIDPEQGGAAYLAEYEGVQYIFDSLVEVPLGTPGVGDVAEYNRERRRAFEMVRQYRDELRAWLEGGAYPSAWKLAK